MSAPPLPEIFGNYVLGDLVEVVSPEAISWLPQTAGWACLGALLLVWLLRSGWRRLRYWYRNRYRREAAARLQQLAANDGDEAWLVELNKLVKLTALAAFPREQVARLSGDEWTEFLNCHCSTTPFSDEQCRLLAIGAYRHTTLEKDARQQLVAACLDWVRNHESPGHV